VKIRPATEHDLDAVVVLELEVFGSAAWSPRQVEEEFSGLGDTRAIWLAETAGEHGGLTPVGYAAGRFVADVADVQRVAVLRSRRRHGVGQQLLDEVVAEAQRRGCDRLMLEVADDNAAALALYGANGFTEMDRRPQYYANGADALILGRPVDG
jgi:ribosomal-protein-alanine N-acetyltransferase